MIMPNVQMNIMNNLKERISSDFCQEEKVSQPLLCIIF